MVKDVSWIPTEHYAGIFGLLKLTIPKILPAKLKHVIVLDTDMVLNNDISKLWQLFNTFQVNDN